MPFDVERHLGAMERSVSSLERDGKPVRAVTLARSYDTTHDDLWDALTNPARIPRWFMPVSGDLRRGGRYQLTGNAGGVITDCDRPSFLAMTWEFGAEVSWVEVRLASEATGSRLTLTHIAPVSDHWARYGPGAVGIGWELGVLGLALHLEDPGAAKMDEATLAASPEGKALITGSGDAWGSAAIAGGEDEGIARASARRTIAFYTGVATDPA